MENGSGSAPWHARGWAGADELSPAEIKRILEIGNSMKTRATKILVVEDERHLARFLEFVLKREKYDVTLAHDGEQALATVEAFEPDGMLLDLGLPKLSGLEVLTQLRTNSRFASLRIIVLTARSYEEAAMEVMAAGADSHCPKPVAPSTLLHKLAELHLPPVIPAVCQPQ